MDYASHIRELCDALGVAHHDHLTDISGSHAIVAPPEGEARRVVTPPVEDELTYWVALHELGHLALGHDPHDIFTVTGATLRKEGEAWQWAFAQSRAEMSPETANECYGYLASYLVETDVPFEQVPEIALAARDTLQLNASHQEGARA